MKKQYKSSIIKNHNNYKKKHGVPLKGYVASYVIFRFGTRNIKKKALWEYAVNKDA